MRPGPILFDLDGTLADTLGDIGASANHIRELAGLPPVELDEVRRMVGDGARVLCERAIRDNPRGLRVDDVWDAYRAHHAAHCTATVEPYPGVRAHLERYADAGHPLAVVTNKPEGFAVRILEHLEMTALLPVVIGGDSTPERKPHPGPLRAALERLGGAADGTMVGDSPQDIRAGRAAGLATIAALFGFQDEPVLRAERADEYWVRFGVPENPGARRHRV